MTRTSLMICRTMTTTAPPCTTAAVRIFRRSRAMTKSALLDLSSISSFQTSF